MITIKLHSDNLDNVKNLPLLSKVCVSINYGFYGVQGMNIRLHVSCDPFHLTL